jgi:DNA-binding GntR family transcriptional regulator
VALTPLITQHVGAQVYERLKHAIVDCSLEPGAFLSDRHLAEELGVSRTPVRDALQQLESTGLVSRRGRAGWAVSSLETRDVGEVFELRRLLETAGLAKIVAWEADRLKELTSMFDQYTTPMGPESIASYLKVDDDFHRTIVAAADNRRLIQAYDVVLLQLDRFRHFTSYRYQGRVDQSLAEHRMVCEALAARDAEAAAKALVAHISSAEAKLTEIVEGAVPGRA